jgi:hypothetical protein
MKQSILNKSRLDKFQLVLDIPLILKTIEETKSMDLDTLQFTVWGMTSPEVTVPETDINYSGQVAKYSSYSRPVYSNIVVNFTVDNEYVNYWTLWNWLNLENNHLKAFFNQDKFPNPTKTMQPYQTTIKMYALNEYNEKVLEFVYTKAFIVHLGAINYNYRDSGETECSFTFAFNQLQCNMLKIPTKIG